ncbi:hypothetical protein [Paraglaciecola marina]|uniref:hypothetical protein n=1 Tax=Paraglaciecola marina TaxID=2500157 RepID=UPI00105FB072|nr:hypothetical protein [Paraglaciecola marina]
MKYLSLAFAAVFNAAAADTAVLLSSQQEASTLSQHVAFTKDIYKGLPLGDSLMVFGDGGVLTTFDVPQNPKYDHPKARMKLRRKELKPVNDFEEKANGNTTNQGALDVPATLGEIGQYQGNITDIVILGSPFYTNPHHGKLDMTGGLLPSDSYLLASPAANPFGTKGLEAQLKGKRVHWLLPKTIDNSLLGHALQRFWHIYIRRQGGELVTFSHSRDIVLKRLLDNAMPIKANYELDKSGKLEMQRVREVEADISLFNEPLSEATPTITDFYQPVTLGIEWRDKGVDLDLYAKPACGELLFYGQTDSQQGRHEKDIRGGHGEQQARYEIITFHKSVDIRTLVVIVNFYYADRPKPTSGSLRVQLAGRTYAVPFRLKASKGNQGKDVNRLLKGGSNTIYSERFSITDIVGAAGIAI